jgi:hypothetical protein
VDSETTESTDDELHYYHQDLEKMSKLVKRFSKTTISKKWIISYKNSKKVKWDQLVLIMAIFNAIIIPLEWGF